MKQSAKKIYNVSCNWYSEQPDASGKNENSWEGKILVFDDNACIGYATDNGHETPTHLLAGTYVEGKGLSIFKVHGTNTRYDPIIFDAFVNDNGEKGRYYGQYLASTPFNLYPLGYATLATSEIEKTEKQNNAIQAIYDEMAEKITSEKDSFNAYTVAFVSVMDIDDMSRKITSIANLVRKDALPEIFKNKAGSQPGSDN